MLRTTRERVLAFRARASHLDAKLGPTGLAIAAAGGLQDSAPRAAIVSLHARVAPVTPGSWEDPLLAQIWGPRGADYVVPRDDLSTFTLGRLPRDPDQCRMFNDIAEKVCRVLDGRALHSREVSDALPELGHAVRLSAITGRVLIRWDASTIRLIETRVPDVDPEDARRELARAFLRWFAPVSVDRFAWWSGMELADAKATFHALATELTEVEFDREKRKVLLSDEYALMNADPVRGVRFLPHNDPYLKIDGPLVVRDPARRNEVFPPPGVKTPFWPVSGGVLVDGEIVGSWARQQRKVTVNQWATLSDNVRTEIEAEALAFPIASKTKASVRWVSV